MNGVFNTMSVQPTVNEYFKLHAVFSQHRVLSCLRAWDQMSVYHYNVVDKIRLTFIGKTTEEIEKQKAFVRIIVVTVLKVFLA